MTPLRRLACALALALPLAPALAAGDRADIDARYQADRQACMGETDPDARRDCLRDAGAVRQEALRGTRDGGATNEAQLQRNAVARCAVHQNRLDRAMCERMAMGDGTVSGSVAGGGVIRELEVEIEPAPSSVPVRGQ